MFKKTGFLRTAVLTFTTVFLVSSFTACSDKGKGGDASKPAATAKMEAPAAQVAWPKVSEQPINLRVFITERADTQISSDMMVVKELSKKTNVNFKFEFAPATNPKEKFNIMIASGDIPDLVIFNYNDIMPHIPNKIFEPLDDLLNQYGKNVLKGYSQYPNGLKDIRQEDGKIYTFHILKERIASEMFMMRTDWLEKLGLKTPDTTDDWYSTLKAFKEKDPNGNGKADEVPFASSEAPYVLRFITAWGLEDNFFVEDGKIKYGPAESRMKEALTYINKLYSEGLIEKEYISFDLKQWNARNANEQMGATHNWATRIDDLNLTAAKANPKAKWLGVPPPKGPGGIRMERRQMDNFYGAGAAAINAKSKYKTEIVKMYDYIYSDEAFMLMNYGIEGQHYTMDNGKPKLTEFITKNPQGLGSQLVQYSLGIMEWPKGQAVKIEDLSPVRAQAYEVTKPFIVPAYPKLKFTMDDRDILKAKFTEIDTYSKEMMNKFIMGVEPLSKFDEFVSNLKKRGLDDVIKVHEAAYKRYSK